MDYTGRIISKTPATPSANAAPGIWTLDEAMQYSKQGKWPPGYQISRSVRLRSSASAYLSWTPSVAATSTQKLTYSAWVKIGKVATLGHFGLSSAITASTRDAIRFYSNGAIEIYLNEQSGADLITTPLYRDPSAWYHIVVAVDTTQATSTDRIKLYINGVQVTTFATATYPALNYVFLGWLVSGKAQNIGRSPEPAYYFDGYTTEINVVDGQQLTPASFGYFDTYTGVWQPAPYTGTYGTNGFYLNFKDPTSTTTIAYDYSGNSNNWTANNISVTAGTTYDSMVDVPINWGTDTGVGGEVRGNYCVMNPLNNSTTLSNGNLTPSAGASSGVLATFNIPSTGSWYWESTITTLPGSNNAIAGILGVNQADSVRNLTADGVRVLAQQNGILIGNGTTYQSGLTAWSANDVIGFAVNASSNTLQFYRNGATYGSAISFPANTYAPYCGSTGSTAVFNVNFGQRAFAYTAPSGYKPLCTQNISVPTVLNGASYMAATLWSGTSALQTVTGVGFQPDFTWIKNRSAAYNHIVSDVVRGASSGYYAKLTPNSTASEAAYGPGDYGSITTFNSNGFILNSANSDWNQTNQSGSNYVGWSWKANGTGVSNTAGTITSSVSANTSAGFSVLTYTGTGATATMGHGLGAVPSMMIMKKRSNAGSWKVYHTVLGNTQIVELNDTAAAQTSSTYWNNTSPTSTLITVGSNGDINASGETYVAYCFAPITGYSAFGSYTGNGSTDGPFIYLGFRPRFVLWKRTDSTGSWYIQDTTRSPYNQSTLSLYPNLADAETSGDDMDYLSNGFKVRDTFSMINASGGTYLYAAFAENPFTIARAR